MAGREALQTYLDATLAKLEQSSNMEASELQKAMTSVVSSVKRMSSNAPAEFQQKINDALTTSGVLPDYRADVEDFKSALRCIREILSGPKSESKLAEAPKCIESESKLAADPSSGSTHPSPRTRPKLLRRQSTMGHRLRGISVQYLTKTFMDEVSAAGLDRNAKVYEIEPLVIRPKGHTEDCPRDTRSGSAYVDCLSEGDAGIATHMLSYTWGYKIGDIVEGLVLFCQLQKLQPETTFFWICCLCINQHRVKEAQEKKETVPFEKFKEEFGDRVSSIGHIVALMAPWNDPFYTKRVWCDFEMYTAASMGDDKCKISVVMPPAEAADMRKTLTSGPVSNPKLWEALQHVKIEHAQASVEEDKERIFELIVSSTGFHTLNSIVVSCLRNWVVSTCEEILSNLDEELKSGSITQQDMAKTCARLGYILRDMHQPEGAMSALTRAVELFKKSGLTETLDWAVLMSNFGAIKRTNNDIDGALFSIQRSEKIFRRIGQTQTIECAMMYNTLGAAQRSKGTLVAALDSFQKGLDIMRDIDAYGSQECASILLSLGSAQKDADDFEGALESFDEAVYILETANLTGIPLMGYIMNSIGTAKKVKKDFAGALEAYIKSKEHAECMGAFESQSGIIGLLNIANCKRQLKDFDGAKEATENAQKLCEKLDLMSSDIGAKVRDAVEKLTKGGKGGKKGKNTYGDTKGGKGHEKGDRPRYESGGYYTSKGDRAKQDGSTNGGKGYYKGYDKGNRT